MGFVPVRRQDHLVAVMAACRGEVVSTFKSAVQDSDAAQGSVSRPAGDLVLGYESSQPGVSKRVDSQHGPDRHAADLRPGIRPGVRLAAPEGRSADDDTNEPANDASLPGDLTGDSEGTRSEGA